MVVGHRAKRYRYVEIKKPNIDELQQKEKADLIRMIISYYGNIIKQRKLIVETVNENKFLKRKFKNFL